MYVLLQHFWYILWKFGNLEVIWYIFHSFGTLYQEKSGNTGLDGRRCLLRLHALCLRSGKVAKRRKIAL
jgi:hypothetical protein